MKRRRNSREVGSAKAFALRAQLIRGGKTILRRLVQRCGPCLSSSEVSLLLGVEEDVVISMDACGRLLGFGRGDHRRYPAWQFACLPAPRIRTWVAPLIESLGGSAAALHFLLGPRQGPGFGGSNQPFLTRILIDDPGAVALMMQHVDALTEDGPSAEKRRGKVDALSGAAPRYPRVGQAPRALNDPTDAHRAVFSDCGLVYGRNFGSKGAYARRHPDRFFVANASVFTRDGRCVWRGDVDLGTASDREGLINASRRLRKALYVLREFSWSEERLVSPKWLAMVAVVAVWRGRIEAVGGTKRLRASLANLMKLSGSAASERPRDYAEKEKGRDAWARRGSQTT